MNLRIRSATKRDVAALFDIRCSVVENHQSREELAELGITEETVRTMIESGDYITTLAEDRDRRDGARAVGFSMAQISEGYIFAAFVRPEYEARGIGKLLMDAAEAGLRRAGVTDVWLSTGSDPHIRANGFYRRLGWTPDGHLEDGQRVYRKRLSGSDLVLPDTSGSR